MRRGDRAAPQGRPPEPASYRAPFPPLAMTDGDCTAARVEIAPREPRVPLRSEARGLSSPAPTPGTSAQQVHGTLEREGDADDGEHHRGELSLVATSPGAAPVERHSRGRRVTQRNGERRDRDREPDRVEDQNVDGADEPTLDRCPRWRSAPAGRGGPADGSQRPRPQRPQGWGPEALGTPWTVPLRARGRGFRSSLWRCLPRTRRRRPPGPGSPPNSPSRIRSRP